MWLKRYFEILGWFYSTGVLFNGAKMLSIEKFKNNSNYACYSFSKGFMGLVREIGGDPSEL